MARLLFLGRLEDLAGAPHLDIPLSAPLALGALLVQLPASLAEALRGPRVRIAVNGALVAPEALTINDADEVAFLPPVSGG